MQVIEAPPEFPEDARKWEHPFLARVRAALDQQLAGVILDFAHTMSLGQHGATALLELTKYAGFVGGVILLQNVPEELAPALHAAGIDRVCFVRLARAVNEGLPADAGPDDDPNAPEREARRVSGGILRLEGPDAGATP
jgi:hypothetical protein